MAEGGWWRTERGGGLGGAESGNHIEFPCYFRHQYGESMDIRVLDFKCKSVNFDNFFSGTKFLANNYLFP